MERDRPCRRRGRDRAPQPDAGTEGDNRGTLAGADHGDRRCGERGERPDPSAPPAHRVRRERVRGGRPNRELPGRGPRPGRRHLHGGLQQRGGGKDARVSDHVDVAPQGESLGVADGTRGLAPVHARLPRSRRPPRRDLPHLLRGRRRLPRASGAVRGRVLLPARGLGLAPPCRGRGPPGPRGARGPVHGRVHRGVRVEPAEVPRVHRNRRRRQVCVAARDHRGPRSRLLPRDRPHRHPRGGCRPRRGERRRGPDPEAEAPGPEAGLRGRVLRGFPHPRRVKLCLVNAFFHPFVGGTEKHMHELGRRLGRTHEVHVFTARLPGTARAEVVDGIRVWRTPARLLRAPLIYPPPFPLARRAIEDLARIDASERFDAFHLHGRWFPDFARVVPYARQTARPVALTLHNARPRGINALTDALGTAYDSLRGIRIIQGVDRSVAVSDWVRRDIARYGVDPARIEVIPNGVDTTVYRPRAPELRERLGGFDPLLLSVGRLLPQKGLDLLIDAVARVAADHPPPRGPILGTGRMRAALEADVRRRGLEKRVVVL